MAALVTPEVKSFPVQCKPCFELQPVSVHGLSIGLSEGGIVFALPVDSAAEVSTFEVHIACKHRRVPAAVVSMSLSKAGKPLAVLSDSTAYAYQPGMGTWMCIVDSDFALSSYASILASGVPGGQLVSFSHRIAHRISSMQKYRVAHTFIASWPLWASVTQPAESPALCFCHIIVSARHPR